MTIPMPRLRLPRLSYQRLFTDVPEDSQRLRTLVLLTVLWVALSLYWVTGSPWIPSAGAAGAAIGNLFSWRSRLSSLGFRTGIVLLAIVGITVVFRDAAVSALTGDRIPVAEYLLLVTAAASFGLRTRGGLYGQLALSGLTLFFVSERAFDPNFAGFLIVFTGLFLTFSAMAFMEDEIAVARVHWPEGQIGRFWFWLGIVGGGLLVCSTLAFSLLPPDYRGRSGSQRVGIVPFMGQAAAELNQAGQSQAGPGAGSDGSGGQFSVGDSPGAEREALREFTESLPQSFEPAEAASNPREIVMNVRSSVTSYWRGAVYDEFDGKTWFRSRDSIVEPAQSRVRNFYWQAYFLNKDQPDSLFVGYKPLRVMIPEEVREQGALLAGSTYSVLSQQPPLNANRVRLERPGRVDPKYRSLRGASPPIQQRAEEIVGDARAPFEAMWRIVSFLRQNRLFNLASPDQLRLSGDIEDFIQNGTTGTSLDFASATVLLAWAAGIPSRVAVGYLPGKFERFSGTHEVKRRDRHAWAEVSFRRFGWVAFDPAPRPEIDRFLTGGEMAFPGGAFLLETRVGGGLYRYMRSGASGATDVIGGLLEGKGDAVRVGGVVIVVVMLVGGLAAWLLYWRPRRQDPRWRYTRLSGEGRLELIRLYGKLERLLARKGLSPRKPGQTLAEFSVLAKTRFHALGPDMDWLTRAAWAAAYDPEWPGPELTEQASHRVARLRRLVRQFQAT